jgi:hypothetical protein
MGKAVMDGVGKRWLNECCSRPSLLPWPALAGQNLEPLVQVLPEVLAIGLLLLIPILWLKPN